MEQGNNLDTFPRLLQSHVKLRPGQDAMREKDLGIWQSWSWAEAASGAGAIARRVDAVWRWAARFERGETA